MRGTIKLHIVDSQSEGDTEAQIKALGKFLKLTTPEEADLLILMSFFELDDAIRLVTYLKKPIVVYCWDYYLWNHGQAQWQKYAAFLKRASAIFVPSAAQQRRLKELLGLDSIVIKSGVTVYKHKVRDSGFILDPVRYYPEENEKWAEKAAQELGIPIIHSEHQYSLEEFRDLVASCTFMTCTYREASTGGLTLLEGLHLGKPSLVSNSPYMGAVDYLGDKGYYFQYNDFEDLKRQMKFLWETRPKAEGKVPTYEQMAKKICEVVKNLSLA